MIVQASKVPSLMVSVGEMLSLSAISTSGLTVLLNMMPAVIAAATNATTRMIAMMIVRVLVLGLA